ncbi:MAG: hypothetical protein AYK18_01135 [Theionarchaea archaeon DG-70]|nr:MAG: hypothetical protein AYK18_01135 [Theionarchaea archaeon DG-70]
MVFFTFFIRSPLNSIAFLLAQTFFVEIVSHFIKVWVIARWYWLQSLLICQRVKHSVTILHIEKNLKPVAAKRRW